jgi:hypothetical protein
MPARLNVTPVRASSDGRPRDFRYLRALVTAGVETASRNSKIIAGDIRPNETQDQRSRELEVTFAYYKSYA